MISTPLEEAANESHRNITVVGAGNRLLGDEGAGLHITDNLFEIPLPPYVDVIDCGCDLLSLISYVNRPQKIIVIDAIRAGGNPGAVYRFEYGKLATRNAERDSCHQLGAADALALLTQLYPVIANSEITVIGIEPKAIELSADLSREVRESVVDVTRLVLEEISPQSSFWQEDERDMVMGARPNVHRSCCWQKEFDPHG